MRERRVAVKRAQSRRRLKRLAIVLGVVLLVVAVLAVLGSPLFAVREGDVEVFGARYTDEERLAEILDGAVGTPVLRVDTDAIEDEIEAIPWVDEAHVSTDFPHGLVVDIRERAAMTTYQGPDGRYRVLDREGRVLDVLDMYPFAYVLLSGPDPVDLEAGDFAPQGYAAASELAKNLTGSMRGRVAQIEVTADGARLVVHLDDGSSVYFGEARDLLAKLVRLETVLANGQDCESGLIDVSTADVTRCSVA
jgi:cell division protein FtsQ